MSTHAGALAKPADVEEMVRAREFGQPYDKDLLAERLSASVEEQVRKQTELGIDYINDGGAVQERLLPTT